jgi:hypothetical protein
MKSSVIVGLSSGAFFAPSVLGSSGGEYALQAQTGCSNWESLEIGKHTNQNAQQCQTLCDSNAQCSDFVSIDEVRTSLINKLDLEILPLIYLEKINLF